MRALFVRRAYGWRHGLTSIHLAGQFHHHNGSAAPYPLRRILARQTARLGQDPARKLPRSEDRAMTRSASGRPLRFFAMMLWQGGSPSACSARTRSTPLPGPHHPSSSLVLTPITLLDASAMTAMRPIHTITMAVRDPDRLPPTRFVKATAVSRSVNSDGMPIQAMDFVAPATDFTHAPPGSCAMTAAFTPPRPSPPPLPARQPYRPMARAGAWLLWRPDSGTTNGAFRQANWADRRPGCDWTMTLLRMPRAGSRPMAGLTRALQRQPRRSGIGSAQCSLSHRPHHPGGGAPRCPGHRWPRRQCRDGGGRLRPRRSPRDPGEAYVRTGIVGFRRRDAFIDSKFSLTTPLDAVPIRLGAALSGGARPGASRLDISPEV